MDEASVRIDVYSRWSARRSSAVGIEKESRQSRAREFPRTSRRLANPVEKREGRSMKKQTGRRLADSIGAQRWHGSSRGTIDWPFREGRGRRVIRPPS
ncbi:hypothetical protein KM043_012131 [Ampulex compressa]|nr:hypothetical protein KM043_012131 [Ampulex compressa]